MITVVGCSVLYTAVAANQAVIAVVPAIRLVVNPGVGNVVVKATVRSVITVLVICPIWSVVRVGAGMVARITRSPRMVVVICVIRRPVNYGSVDVGVVVVGDTPAATTPSHIPGVPAPTATPAPK